MRIVFRTEGNHGQGMGDLWGSIALADECARESDEIFFIISGGKEAVSVLQERGYQFCTVDSFAAEREILQGFHPNVVVVNKLNSAPEYIRSLRDFADLIVTIDDSGEGARCADLRINVLYHVPDAVTALEYISLRKEFQEIHGKAKTIRREAREILITQGGSDTDGFTPRIIQALEKMARRPYCTVVLGPAFQHQSELEKAVASSTLDLSLVFNPCNMADLMWEADLAITAGGLTMFELACVGTPSIVVCAELFETETASRLEKTGAVINLGFGGDLDDSKLAKTVDALFADIEARKRMSSLGKQLVDGRGSGRIVRLLREGIGRACQDRI